jgi:hypothetical protein
MDSCTLAGTIFVIVLVGPLMAFCLFLCYLDFACERKAKRIRKAAEIEYDAWRDRVKNKSRLN